jgi:RNA polymerase sigma-70 factor (ECF subfamily)
MPQSQPSPARSRPTGTAERAVQDRTALWIRDHLDAVYRYARRRLSADDAEDVAQQAFVALFRADAAGRAPEDAGAYLFGVARRRIADVHRRRARRPEPVSLPEGWEGIATTVLPETALEHEELRSLVQIALGLVPGRDAALLRRRYQGRAGTAELAAELDISVKAVEMRLRRARASFLAHFERVGRDWSAPEDPAGDGEALL